MKLTVRAPATVANLGPGFDCLGLALDLSNVFELDTDGEPGIHVEGEGAGELASGRANLVLRAIEHAFALEGRDVPPFRLSCTNRVPLRRGLGSSATAAVAGVLLAARLLERPLDRVGSLRQAIALERHADNVAACLLGGLTIAYMDDDEWHAARLEPNEALEPVVFVPDAEETETASARAALPEEVAFGDTVFALSRTALAVHALTNRPDLLAVALQDRLHQRRRLELAPVAAVVFDDLTSRGIPACVAGSGPSILAFGPDARPMPPPGPGWRVLRPAVDLVGATLSEG